VCAAEAAGDGRGLHIRRPFVPKSAAGRVES
jgi:hypothetical protein